MFEVFDNNIEFFEEDHKYKFKGTPDVVPLSVTGVIGKYKKPFDSEYHAARKAEQLGISKDNMKEKA